MSLQKRSMLSKSRFCLALISFLFLFPSFACKKNPIIPNAEELTRPVIWLDTSEVSFIAYESGGNPSTQVFKVKNSGRNALSYSISDDADWLSVEPANGSSTGQLVEHTILINKAGLAARDDDYKATITIVCSEAYNNPQRLNASLKISAEPPPEIWVSPLEITFAAQVGKNPSARTLRVKNVGKGTLAYDVTWDAPWITVAPAGGTSGGEEKTHTVSVDSKSLAEGSYDGNITVTSGNASNSPQRIGVRLEVGDNPPPSTDNRISIACSPASGGTGTLVSIPVSIRGNLQEISTFGLELTFDSNLFQYQSTSTGNLTGGWSVGGGESGGVVTVGGFAGSANAIPVGSVGSIAIVKLKVKTGTGYSDGQQSQITIRGYIEDIQGMQPEPCSTSFTFRQ
jgi:hypothetical protein